MIFKRLAPEWMVRRRLLPQSATSNPGGPGLAPGVFGSGAVTLADMTISGTAVNVPTDGPDKVFLPGTAANWTSLGLPAPSNQWNCQEASGNLIGALGGVDLAAANTGHLFQQSVTGWTAKAVGFAGSDTGSWSSANAAFAVAEDQSFAMLAYASLNNGGLLALTFLNPRSGSYTIETQLSDTNILPRFAGTGISGTINYNNLAVVHPFLIGRNCTTDVARCFTDNEQVNGTFNNAAITSGFGIGGLGGLAVQSRFVHIAWWKGADAETVLAKSTLTTLRWSLSY